MDELLSDQGELKGRRKGLWVTAVILILALVSFGGYKGWQYYQARTEQARMAEIQAEAAAQIEQRRENHRNDDEKRLVFSHERRYVFILRHPAVPMNLLESILHYLSQR